MSLRRAAVSGTKWTAASSLATTGIQFVQIGVLAHLLSPEDFGLMAMIMVVLGFAQAYADMGIGNAIIYRQQSTQDELSSLYWLNLAFGLLIYLIIFASTPAIVAFFAEPRLAQPLAWSAALFLVIPVGQQFFVLLQRDTRFRPIALLEIGGATVGLAVAITAAWFGQGVYALVWGQLANAATKAMILLAIGWVDYRPSLHFRPGDLHGYVGFGLFQMGERSVNFLNSRLDQMLIGSLLGAQALGYYNLAWNLVIQPVTKINPIVTRVAFPLFARVQNEQTRLRRGYLLTQRLLSTVNFPLLLGLAAVAPLLLPLVLGERWTPAVILVQLLAGVALFRSTGNPMGALLLSKGRADLGFYANVALVFFQVPGILLGARLGGAPGVALALLLLQILYFVLSYPVLIRRVLEPCLWQYYASVLPALAISLAMALSVAVIPRFAGAHVGILVGQILFGALVYALLTWLVRAEDLRDLRRLLLERGR